ncbi:MAG: sugar transferase [candidate division KSB1 bacterium]|nr:sugar transferase [candidate division KSB1 bacterium]MDZ7273893.1 sugar transferase [candidate division KSB1 bacterium]MDZ7286049.1 sugar transferase [candidate division KSB1 bacterium]MDZ7299081.1 sugar transferase [candidate division KSB1 bacterium]MDZ7306384.1 sugar transferase [candidate division KSB1 bacterium]
MRQELGIRCLDVLVASIALLLALPLLAVVAMVVKISSPGPVFCRQIYAGVDRRRRQRRIMNLPLTTDRRQPEKRKKDLFGKPFTVYRFRTTSHDPKLEELAALPFARDLHVTAVGRRLRAWRLDELPVLWNVVRGEMSLVGPRPETPGLISKRVDAHRDYRKRQQVKPGLTGLAQLYVSSGSHPADAAHLVDFDLYYVKHRDWRLYLHILAMSVSRMVRRGRNESSARLARLLRHGQPCESEHLLTDGQN